MHMHKVGVQKCACSKLPTNAIVFFIFIFLRRTHSLFPNSCFEIFNEYN